MRALILFFIAVTDLVLGIALGRIAARFELAEERITKLEYVAWGP